MTNQYVPKLRQRFLEDMQIKGPQPKTQTMYLRAMREFTRYLGHSPEVVVRIGKESRGFAGRSPLTCRVREGCKLGPYLACGPEFHLIQRVEILADGAGRIRGSIVAASHSSFGVEFCLLASASIRLNRRSSQSTEANDLQDILKDRSCEDAVGYSAAFTTVTQSRRVISSSRFTPDEVLQAMKGALNKMGNNVSHIARWMNDAKEPGTIPPVW